MKERPEILLYVTAALAIVGIGAYLFWPDCWLDCKSIVTSVVVSPDARVQYGKISLIPATAIDGGIDSDGYGGECLFFSDPAARVCGEDTDCALPANAATDAHRLCSKKQCWVNPGGNYCWRGADQTPPAPLGDYDRHNLYFSLESVRELFPNAPANQPLEVSAKVIACLNGKFDLKDNPPCKGGPGRSKVYISKPVPLVLPAL